MLYRIHPYHDVHMYADAYSQVRVQALSTFVGDNIEGFACTCFIMCVFKQL